MTAQACRRRVPRGTFVAGAADSGDGAGFGTQSALLPTEGLFRHTSPPLIFLVTPLWVLFFGQVDK